MSQVSLKQVIPDGYKQTEVGVIPEDWEVRQLGDCTISIGSGKTNTKNVGDFPLYGSTGLIGSCIVPEYEGDGILVARVGANAGKLAFVKGQYGVSDNTILVKLKLDNDIHFFKYWLVKRNLNSLVFGSGQPLITGTQLKNLPLSLPPKKEQTAIANALSDVDLFLSGLEKLIAKKQAIKTATMQQLLTGKTRLPQFAYFNSDELTEGELENKATNKTSSPMSSQTADTTPCQGKKKGTKPSELGEIPEDWEVKAFGDVMKIRHGRSQNEVESINGPYPILATGGKIGNSTSFLYDKPSVLIGRKGTINKPRYTDQPFWTVDTLFYSEISKFADAKFIYYKFCMIDWMQYNEASGVPSLNASTIERVSASIPHKEEQIAIATILSDMDEEIQALSKRLTKTRQIKQGMMQELLTGKTRLPFDKK